MLPVAQGPVEMEDQPNRIPRVPNVWSRVPARRAAECMRRVFIYPVSKTHSALCGRHQRQFDWVPLLRVISMYVEYVFTPSMTKVTAISLRVAAPSPAAGKPLPATLMRRSVNR